MRHSISYDNGATFITSECGDICTIATQCSSIISGFPGKDKKHIATEKQAQMIYKAELQAYKNEKKVALDQASLVILQQHQLIL